MKTTSIVGAIVAYTSSAFALPVSSTSSASPATFAPVWNGYCAGYHVRQTSDTCTSVASEFNITLTKFQTINPAVNCANLEQVYQFCIATLPTEVPVDYTQNMAGFGLAVSAPGSRIDGRNVVMVNGTLAILPTVSAPQANFTLASSALKTNDVLGHVIQLVVVFDDNTVTPVSMGSGVTSLSQGWGLNERGQLLLGGSQSGWACTNVKPDVYDAEFTLYWDRPGQPTNCTGREKIAVSLGKFVLA